VVEELNSVDKQLKGETLSMVIQKIQEISHQHPNDLQGGGGAGLGSNNRAILVLYELLEVFKVMMKQLKLT
jgi:hypothetical protein